MADNTTALACINHIGISHSVSCNSITQAMWEWCITHNVWISAAHIPGKDNTAADLASRHINLDAEWKVDTEMLRSALLELKVDPTINLFASRLNTQFKRYMSFRLDPEAVAVDAFSVLCMMKYFMPFPLSAFCHKCCRRHSGTRPQECWWYPISQHRCGIQS